MCLQDNGTIGGNKEETGTTEENMEETGTIGGNKAEAGTTEESMEETGTIGGNKAETGTTEETRVETGTTGGNPVATGTIGEKQPARVTGKTADRAAATSATGSTSRRREPQGGSTGPGVTARRLPAPCVA